MTAIEWTDATWNPVTGCDRISPGCDNCYALTLAKRLQAMGQARYQNDGDPRTSGPGFGLTCHPDALDIPLRWRKPRRVFVNSMSDLFHKDVPDDFIARVFAVMARTPQHTFQVLTKRPQRMASLLTSDAFLDAAASHRNRDEIIPIVVRDDGSLRNVWLGTSIESDRYAFRADHLRAAPAAVRFLSLEPLLGQLPSLDLTGIDWVIVGGESGPGARPMHPDWVRDIRGRCVAAGVPFFFKQLGAWTWQDRRWPPSECDLYLHADGRTATEDEAIADGGMWKGMWRLGKKATGRELDGETWDQYPEVVAS